MAKELKLPISTLKADPRNPRKIADDRLTGLKTSLETFGPLDIVFNEASGELVSGHQRVRSLTESGATQVVRESGTEWGYIVHPRTKERFPVRFVHWDAVKQRMANLVANNPHIQGEFTEEAVGQLRELQDQIEYEALHLDELAATLQDELDVASGDGVGNTDADADVTVPDEPISKRGDLYLLGEHRLLCGDSTSAADVARLMDGKKAVMLATDPPYGVDYVAVKSSIPGMEAIGRFDDIANDDLKDDNLGEFLDKMFAAARPALVENAAIYIWHPSGELNHVFRTSMVRAGMLVHRQIIWVKPQFVMTRSGMYHWQHEPCFYGWYQGHIPPWYGEKNQASVWDMGRDDGKAVHPTQKPVALFETPMLNHARPGEICLELFSGSGSQIIAGEKSGRRVYAMELSPRYVDAAVARWEAYTGKTATRIRDGA